MFDVFDLKFVELVLHLDHRSNFLFFNSFFLLSSEFIVFNAVIKIVNLFLEEVRRDKSLFEADISSKFIQICFKITLSVSEYFDESVYVFKLLE